MKRFHRISLALLTGLALFACTKNVFTGRSQLQMLPIETLNQMSFQQYNAYLGENKPMSGGAQVDKVRRIGNDLRMATEVYYKAKGIEDQLKNFQWEFNVVDEKTVNAFCMPGGKVVVYTGIMDVAQNDDGLAVVMGHEIAHALAHHGNERMSQGLIAQLGITTLDVAMQDKPEMTRSLLMAAAGLGTQVGIMLPFSRKHETEADEIGLYLMAMAGYNPDEAAPFWGRMGAGGQAPPEFLSTHPNPERRSATLQALAAKAREYAAQYPVPGSSRNRK